MRNWWILLLLLLFTGCTRQQPRYVIGVSQCSADIWREKQNAELRMGAYLHDDVELRFASAYDSDERQIQQIDSLIQTGIDLLIVAPNQVQTISPAIDRAYDRGIPVIVFERKTNSKKYTAYMGADNYEMGHIMGEYIARQLQGHGRVLEIMGLRGSSPAIERHHGFADALSRYPAIQLTATLQGDWTEQSGYEAVKKSLSQGDGVLPDFVFGQNDRMAMGARRAMMEHLSPSSTQSNAEESSYTLPAGTFDGTSLPRFCGIDGLPGEQGGICQVRDSLLDATYIYPTHGDLLLDMAIKILDGQPYEKEVLLKAALVTRDNASVLLMQNDETIHQTVYLDQLHEMASDYLHQLDTQRLFTWLLVGFVLLLLLMATVTYLYYRQRIRINRERAQMARQQLDFYTQAAHQLRTPLTLIEGPLTQLGTTPDMQQAGEQARSMFDIVSRNTRQLSELVNKLLDAQTGETATTEDTTWSELPQASAPELPAQSSATQDITLLLVDDNADIRTYLRTILQDRYRLLEAADGQHGLELAQEEVPDLIVSDVMMPVMNGLEFCQRVKDNMATSHIPVILLTARALSRHQVEGYQSGADAYLTKPFQPEVLLACISNMLQSRIHLRQLWSQSTPAEPVAAEQKSSNRENVFLQRFQQTLSTHLADSNFSIEDLGSELGLSRVQMYRKVKALTGQSPVELLRTARLQRGRELLQTTDKTISEVAYEVGFTSPSYFSKCFKEEFGQLPGNLRG